MAGIAARCAAAAVTALYLWAPGVCVVAGLPCLHSAPPPPQPLLPRPCSGSGSTIPYWLVIVVGVLSIAASILAAELWLARHTHADASDALAAALHFFLDAISAFFVTGLVTEVRCGG